jgi:Zn-dependent membrane protease YugP
MKKTVNLSRSVYSSNSIAAAAVAAHECGHAVQHARAYAWLQMRSALVPVVSFASNWVQWILLAGILLIGVFPQLLLAGIVLFALTTIFSIITLPVEVDASRRALAWLSNAGITSYETHEKATDALRWAAYTYFIAAITSLATLLYYILIYLGRRIDRAFSPNNKQEVIFQVTSCSLLETYHYQRKLSVNLRPALCSSQKLILRKSQYLS